jgi:dipeptidyl aminopeptidase/acylaminoacyl peptidase
MMWDKPGFGQSTGTFSRQHLRAERAEILLDAISNIKSHPRIDSSRMGIWGISQAGYVIPMSLPKTDDISFMIMVGCPGEDGIHQTAYLIRRQLEFEGVSEEEDFFNPIDIIEKTTIPVLVFFGEKDTQVDPIQGVSSYKKALTKAGNKNFRVELIPNADHNIILCKTGSLKERNSRSSKEWQNYAPEYLEIMEDWLKKLP